MSTKPDGLIHLLKEVTSEKGTRIVKVKCGAEMPKFRSMDALSGATAWDSKITCSACKPSLA